MSTCNKDTAGTDMFLQEIIMYAKAHPYKFEWIGTKFQLGDAPTKSWTPGTFGYPWSFQLTDVNNHHMFK